MKNGKRRLSIGAEMIDDELHFRVWAPKRKRVEVLLQSGKKFALSAESGGYFSGSIKKKEGEILYRYLLDEEDSFPDPASRFQPEGPHGPSQVIDPNSFKWSDEEWRGIVEKEKVILYELHVGTFTQEGSWLAAIEKLPHLLELGITVIEMMPICEFPGRFNWGYDGVNFFAPSHNYGRPDDLRKFINEAHKMGLGVILDVVYNHFGPDGNFLGQFSDDYFKKEKTEWGDAINFDQENSGPVRQFFIENGGYWIEEFHFDGLRFDACHAIQDESRRHILLEITQKVREKGGKKATYVTAENEKQSVQLIQSADQGGFTMDAIWNEDFHHAAFVRLIGHNEAYFSEYKGKCQEFISSLKYNFLSQGQWYQWQNNERGTVAIDFPPHLFINFLENHDQVANTGSALHLFTLAHRALVRTMTTLWLLSPQIPLFFQGQEFGSSSPFHYFSELPTELAKKVFSGRLEFMSQFKSIDDPDVQEKIPFPHDPKTFQQSKINWKDKERHQPHYQLHRDLIEMRKKDPVFSHFSEVTVDGALIDEDFFLIRYFSSYGDRLLLINLGIDYHLYPASEPLLAPPRGHIWNKMWSSEMPRYGGFGYLKTKPHHNWKITGHSASILYPEES